MQEHSAASVRGESTPWTHVLDQLTPTRKHSGRLIRIIGAARTVNCTIFEPAAAGRGADGGVPRVGIPTAIRDDLWKKRELDKWSHPQADDVVVALVNVDIPISPFRPHIIEGMHVNHICAGMHAASQPIQSIPGVWFLDSTLDFASCVPSIKIP